MRPALLGLPLALAALAAFAPLAGGCAGEPAPVLSESSDEKELLAKIDLERTWYLLGDGLTEGAESASFRFSLPSRFSEALVAFDGKPVERVTRPEGGGDFEASLSLEGLGPGEHRILVGDPETYAAIGVATIQVSFPLYVVVSNDWDDTRMGEGEVSRMERLREGHPGLKITQFYAPYHYTDPEITEEWRQEIDGWIKRQRDEFGDELGLHIHGWCHFVETTGVDCRTKETFYKDDGSGYTTILAAYPEDDMTRILEGAVEMFDKHDLGRPRSFRAGGWTTDVKVMRALVRAGFTNDSSAVPAKYLSTWKGYGLWDFTTKTWEGITETSQPYFPGESDITKGGGESALPLLEVPDNGVLVDYVTAEDMLRIFEMNYEGRPLEAPTVYQVGFHSTNFSEAYLTRLDQALSRVDAHLHDADLGPARYVNITDLEQVYRR